MGVPLRCLRNLRLGQSLTQRALAAKSGVSASTICRLEQGKPVASIRVIHQLARGLDVPPAELLQESLTRESGLGASMPRWRRPAPLPGKNPTRAEQADSDPPEPGQLDTSDGEPAEGQG